MEWHALRLTAHRAVATNGTSLKKKRTFPSTRLKRRCPIGLGFHGQLDIHRALFFGKRAAKLGERDIL
jgi:hypothetical protein